MALTGNTTEEKIWLFLRAEGLSAHGAAALMGNLYAESALNPKNLQNTYERVLGYNDDTYTAAVDSGKYTNFVNDSAGYDLAQWTYHTRKCNLLNFAKSCGQSVGDLEMQLCFLIKELSTGYKLLLDELKTAKNVRIASDAVLKVYERPTSQSSYSCSVPISARDTSQSSQGKHLPFPLDPTASPPARRQRRQLRSSRARR